MLWARTLYQGWGIRVTDYTFEDVVEAMRIEMAERERRRHELEKAKARGQ